MTYNDGRTEQKPRCRPGLLLLVAAFAGCALFFYLAVTWL